MRKPRSLMLLKTGEGAGWALSLAKKLVEAGVLLSAVLPDRSGSLYKEWLNITDECFIIDLNIRGKKGVAMRKRAAELREAIERYNPDLVHSFFFDTTIVCRLALKGDNRPMLFHVPGPLHLENRVTRFADIASARSKDYWIASSKATQSLYERSGIHPDRVFLAYFGVDLEEFASSNDNLELDIREYYMIPREDVLLVNVSFFYPPKLYLGHLRGIKNHENLIKGFSKVLSIRDDATLLLAGKEWGEGHRYEERLRRMAAKHGKEKIVFTGYLPHDEAIRVIRAADLNIHIPTSENCGGIVEAALLRKPSIISKVGGLTDIIDSSEAGYIVAKDHPADIAKKIIEAIDDRENWPDKADKAYLTARMLFDINRTTQQILDIYSKVLKEG